MKFKVTVEFTYSVDDGDALEYYSTEDPRAMADIDRQNFEADPAVLGAEMADNDYTVRVEPA